MEDLPFAMVVADAQLPDMPLVYVNSAFERISGYSRNAVIGRNCRFLQGENTDDSDRMAIREALAQGEEITIDIVNYRSTGEEFINRLLLSPLKQDGKITHFLGIQSEQPKDKAYADRAAILHEQLREVQHRVKNHLALLLSLIRMESKKGADAKSSLDVLANRVEALNLLYDEFSRPGQTDGNTVALGAYISRVCSALNMLDGHREVRMNLETDEFRASVDSASQMGLLVSELLTNALQHAFEAEHEGTVDVRLWNVEDGETDLPAGVRQRSWHSRRCRLAQRWQPWCAHRARTCEQALGRIECRNRKDRHEGDDQLSERDAFPRPIGVRLAALTGPGT